MTTRHGGRKRRPLSVECVALQALNDAILAGFKSAPIAKAMQSLLRLQQLKIADYIAKHAGGWGCRRSGLSAEIREGVWDKP